MSSSLLPGRQASFYRHEAWRARLLPEEVAAPIRAAARRAITFIGWGNIASGIAHRFHFAAPQPRPMTSDSDDAGLSAGLLGHIRTKVGK